MKETYFIIDDKLISLIIYLGTGIGAHMLSVLNKSNIPGPKAVILESPFNNMKDEITVHPFSWVRTFKESCK